MSYNPTRRIDPQGRIMIPSHIRKALNLSPGQLVTVELGPDRIIQVKPAIERCVICGKTIKEPSDTTAVLGKDELNVCTECAKKIADAEKERGR